MINWQKSAELNNTTIEKLKVRYKRFPKSNKKIIRICDECNKEDIISIVAYNKASHSDLCKICGCSSEYSPHWKGGLVIKTCQQCGEEYEVKPSKKDSKFCSCKCHNEWMKENQNGENNPRWLGGKTTKLCQYCNNEFESAPSANQKFCSHKCKNKWHSENFRGEIHPNWTGGLNQKYCYKFNEECRESNRIKYDRKCFICDKSEIENNNRKLSVHHIDMNKQQGCDSEWKLVPLCQSCHIRCHNNLWQSRLEYLLNNIR